VSQFGDLSTGDFPSDHIVTGSNTRLRVIYVILGHMRPDCHPWCTLLVYACCRCFVIRKLAQQGLVYESRYYRVPESTLVVDCRQLLSTATNDMISPRMEAKARYI
jgi:hypothetical protein